MGKLLEYIELLKDKDVRMTTQRTAILANLLDGNKHPTVNEIYEDLKDEFPSMSVATIYNNLKFFKEAGIVKELPFGDGSSRFDLTTIDHFHTICRNCGKIEDFHFPSLVEDENLSQAIADFQPEDYRFEIIGLCTECQRKLAVN